MTEKSSKGKSKQSTLIIFSFIKPYLKAFILGMLFLILSSATVMIFPFITGKLVDAATGTTSWWLKDINKITIGLIFVLILQGLFSYGRVICFAIVSEKSMADIRKALYERLITLPIPFFENRRVGELVSRITADVTQLQDTVSLTLAEFFRQIATLIIGVSVILITSTELTLLMLVTFPLIIIIAVIFGRHIRRLSRKTQDTLADSNVIVEETLQSINIVKAFTNEFLEVKKFNDSIKDMVGYALKAAKYRGAFISFVILGLFGGIVLVLWYGSLLVSRGEITIGELTAFIIYTTFIGGAVGGMGDVYTKLQKTLGASERLVELLDEEQEIKRNDISNKKIQINGELEFDDVTFSYPTRSDIDVLKNVSFQIKKGQKVALVGPSGAGKSTVVQLLNGFYKASTGAISIDSKKINDYPLHDLRGQIGMVPQEVILFGGSILENILYGKPEASFEEVTDAAKKANALEFINSFPEKFDTLVGERGVKLSGGQKQRLAIARAILKDPSILILDEATSSLDAKSEVLVQEALEELMKGRTSIIIAHRLSTIRKADRIFVFNHGELVEEGSHETLMTTDGLYSHLIKLQFEF